MKLFRKLVVLMLMLLGLLSLDAYAQNEIMVYYDNEPVIFDAEPIIVNSRTLVPMRAIFEKFGMDVEYNKEERSVHAINKDNDITIYIDKTDYISNGQSGKLDVAPTIRNGRTLVPVRFIAEELKLTVEWDKSLNAVIILSPGVNKDIKITDNIVYSTDMKLYLGSQAMYGIVKINGEFYLPLDLLSNYSNTVGNWIKLYRYDDGLRLSVNDGNYTIYDLTEANLNYSRIPPKNKIMGTAKLEDYYITVNDEDKILYYTIDGFYEMVRINDLSKYTTVSIDELGKTIKMFQTSEINPANIPTETDLVGKFMWSTVYDSNSDRQNIQNIHDYIAKAIEYDPTYKNMSTTETEYERVEKLFEDAWKKYKVYNNVALETGYAVCSGYTQLFQEACTRAGIPCTVVSGKAAGQSHTWNRVYIDNEWKFVDVTWDDPVRANKDINYVGYLYFLVSADEIYCTHYWNDKDYVMPDYDASWQSLDYNNITSEDMYRKCMIAQLVAGKKIVELKVTSGNFFGGFEFIQYYRDKGLISFYRFRGGYDRAKGKYIFYFDEACDN